MPSITPSSNLRQVATNALDNGQTQARAQLTNAAATPSDPRAAEVGRKVDALVQRQFGGDYKKAFQHYAGANGEVSPQGVKNLLRDAGVSSDVDIPFVGNPRNMTRDALMDKFDTNRNGGVSWSEFTGGMRSVGVNVGQ